MTNASVVIKDLYLRLEDKDKEKDLWPKKKDKDLKFEDKD